MFRVYLITIWAFSCWIEGHCQLKKFYTVKDAVDYDTVNFSLKATSGTCFIKPSHHDDPVTIYGNPSFADVNPNFRTQLKGRTNHLRLDLEDYKKKGLSHTIAHTMFGEDHKSETNYWKVYLTEDKVYNLDLNYGVGDAHIDLSDIAVSKFALESGSADVHITYKEDKKNLCPMDTFAVNVDMGTLVVERLYSSKVKYVLAEVGFGTMILDLSEKMTSKCVIKAAIGAGQLKIILPEKDSPSIVSCKSSPLCQIKMNDEFEKVADGVFVNKSFNPDAENLIEFDLDVALGNIVFEYAK